MLPQNLPAGTHGDTWSRSRTTRYRSSSGFMLCGAQMRNPSIQRPLRRSPIQSPRFPSISPTPCTWAVISARTRSGSLVDPASRRSRRANTSMRSRSIATRIPVTGSSLTVTPSVGSAFLPSTLATPSSSLWASSSRRAASARPPAFPWPSCHSWTRASMRVISGTDVTVLSPAGLAPRLFSSLGGGGQQVGQARDPEGDAARLVHRQYVAAGALRSIVAIHVGQGLAGATSMRQPPVVRATRQGGGKRRMGAALTVTAAARTSCGGSSRTRSR